MEILEQAREAGRLVILLMGRPYHLDPLINHGVPQILVDLGVDVITEDAVPLEAPATLKTGTSRPSGKLSTASITPRAGPASRRAWRWCSLNSFACGPDAFTLDEVKSILDSLGKGHTDHAHRRNREHRLHPPAAALLDRDLRADQKPAAHPAAQEATQAV